MYGEIKLCVCHQPLSW